MKGAGITDVIKTLAKLHGLGLSSLTTSQRLSPYYYDDNDNYTGPP